MRLFLFIFLDDTHFATMISLFPLGENTYGVSINSIITVLISLLGISGDDLVWRQHHLDDPTSSGFQGCNRWTTCHMADFSLIYLVATIPQINSSLFFFPNNASSYAIKYKSIHPISPFVVSKCLSAGLPYCSQAQDLGARTPTPTHPIFDRHTHPAMPRDFPCMPALCTHHM